MNLNSTIITLEDVAQEMGVHKSSVSLALRNKPGVGRVLALRIQTKAAEMGYRPDPLLGAFTQQRARAGTENPVIAILCGMDDREALDVSPLHGELLRGLRVQAAKRGHLVDVFFCGSDKYSPARLDGILRARGIRKLILLAPGASDGCWLNDWGHYTSICLDSLCGAPNVDVIMADYRAAVRTAVHTLVRQGLRCIRLLVTETDDGRLGHLASAGYLQALHELGVWGQQAKPADTSIAAVYSPSGPAVMGCAGDGTGSDMMCCGCPEDYQRLAAAAVDLIALRGVPTEDAQHAGRSVTYLPMSVRMEGLNHDEVSPVIAGSVLGAFSAASQFMLPRKEALSA